MKNSLIKILVLLILIGCQNKSANKDSITTSNSFCTNKLLINELEQKSMNYEYLSKCFKIDKTQYVYFYKEQDRLLSNWMREHLLAKFTERIIDSSFIKTECNYNEDEFITVGDLALYCIAKTELMPFALATGSQNCTEPNISSEITLPINFYKYSQFDRFGIQKRYREYLKSQKRIDYLRRKGYD